MGTIPTVPSFASNDSSLTNLQEMSTGVKFLTQVANTTGLPAWHYYATATQSLSANTTTQVQYNKHALDTDSTYTSTGIATVNTQGIYYCSATVGFASTATNEGFFIYFLITAGSSNPNHSSGATVKFGGGGIGTPPESGLNPMQSAGGYTPWACYPGDTIEVIAFAAAAFTILSTGAAYSQFYGRFIQYQSTP
jgi:hypothetical protein